LGWVVASHRNDPCMIGHHLGEKKKGMGKGLNVLGVQGKKEGKKKRLIQWAKSPNFEEMPYPAHRGEGRYYMKGIGRRTISRKGEEGD